MKHWFFAVSLAIGFCLMAPPIQVQADSDSGSGSDSGSRGSNGGSVPELDATAAGAAMVLMLGGVAYIVSRRRKNDAG